MKLYYPIKPVFITQKFGERPEVYKQFGLNSHNGVDFRTKFDDTPLGKRYVYAAADGKILKLGNEGNKGYGKYVQLTHTGGAQTLYAHLHKFYVKEGQKIKVGEKIALTDNTGFSSAPHLHFGYRPAGYDYFNGNKGYVDPFPFFVSFTSLENRVKETLAPKVIEPLPRTWKDAMKDVIEMLEIKNPTDENKEFARRIKIVWTNN